ncbi:MAG: hypothetical protein KDC12_04190 [Flavobacteriales bacterium]|nr:hypothetical protein [Flavobacteriales bacterium]
MAKRLLTLPLIFTVLLMACGGSSALTKKAIKLEDAGLNAEAAGMYYDALVKKSTNTDAKIGLKKTGQILLGQKLSDFSKARNFGTHKEAVYAFLEAQKYQEKVARVGVQLDFPDAYLQDYQIVKDQYLTELYEEGTIKLDEGRYSDAEKVFKEISQLDPSFKDADDLKEIAYVEPIYQTAVTALASGSYRTALSNFNKVENRRPGYKETRSLQARTLEEGKFGIALMSFENSSTRRGLEAMVEAYVLEALTTINDPFLKIVDRDNLQTIIDEQTLGMSGVIDEQTAASVGQLLGARALVTGTVLNYTSQEGRTLSSERTGYEQYQVKRYDKVQDKQIIENKYREKKYKEYTRENKCSVTFQYKVVSLETGEILLTKMITKENSDMLHYADYDGEDLKAFFPAGANGQVNTTYGAQRSLHELVNAPRQIKSAEELTQQSLEDASFEMKYQFTQLLNQQIK